MSEFLDNVRTLVAHGEVRISDHGYDELAADNIYSDEVIDGIGDAQVIEEYPNYAKGHCILVLQKDKSGKPIHVVWGIPKGAATPAVLITAYKPETELWSKDFLRRRS